MVVNGRPLKKMKRRVTTNFLTFPTGEILATRPFRLTLRGFLLRHALQPPSSLVQHLLTWQVLFDGDVCLDVVEEDVMRSRSVYCDQCRVVGWSGNPVCGKRYHFIIKSDGTSISGNKPCAGCGALVHLSDSRCKSCNHVMKTEDIEDWLYNQLDHTNHLLHGVVHMNGYGHILRVNGREGGSWFLSGSHIMDFWDRLCRALGVRQVSVMDVSKKYGLEFRLLHSVIKGHPWYGDWGYKFGGGSYGISYEAYNNAIETLANMPLSMLSVKAGKPRTHLNDMVSFYQSLSSQELVTSRDLFRCLTTLLHDANKNRTMGGDYWTTKRVRLSDSRVFCVWDMGDIVRVEEAMLRVLKAVSGSGWVSWGSLRGAVCKVGRPELLDYCLKELKGKRASDGLVVNARSNPGSGFIEYRLEPDSSNASNIGSVTSCPSEDTLMRDLKYLYEALLHPQLMVSFMPFTMRDKMVNSATMILDCKQFVKNYHPERSFLEANPGSLILSCKPELDEQTEENVINPPAEHIIVPANATVYDVKLEASKAFQEVYLVLRRFQAEEVVGYRGVYESTQIKAMLGSNTTVNVVGKCLGKSGLSRFRMERGEETWTLDCSCGAKDDDGERMLACDVCGV
ncbi:PHD finger protein At1g33420-like [Bidens hawaiensis]|uniref:PHD finger protein At1g33420-like n=1 Tax=Bidens hawaiensis TaxID=980011 RepID=UPI00404A6A0A